MTCPYGSQPAAGAPTYFSFPESDIAALLPGLGGFVSYAFMGIPSGQLNTAAFCATYPEGDPATNADYALLAGVPGPIPALAGAYARLGNTVKQAKFRELCVCNSASTTGWCDMVNQTYTHPTSGSRFVGGQTQMVLPAGVTHLRVTLTGTDGSADLVFTDINDAITGVITVGANPTAVVLNIAPPPYAVNVQVPYGSTPVYVHIEWDCPPTSLPPSPPTLTPPTGWVADPGAPACTTQQDVCNAIYSLHNHLIQLEYAVADLQKQATPWSYKTGAPIGPLSGAGELAVAGILGLSVELSGLPSWSSVDLGDPPNLYDVGRIALGTPEGWASSIQLRHNPQLVLGIAAVVTRLGYTLAPGVTAQVQLLTAD